MTESYQIILLEDNSDDAELIQLKLVEMENAFQLTHISTIEELEIALDEMEPDLVISDYNLQSGETGLDAFALVRKMTGYCPFVLISGKIGEETAVEAVKSGVDDYVMKNNLKLLPLTVDRMLDHLEERRKGILEEQILRTVFSNSEVGILILDEDLTIVDCNQLIATYSGYDMEELIGKKKSELYLEGEQEMHEHLLNQVFANGVGLSHEWILLRKDNTIRQIHSTISLVPLSEKSNYLVSFISDITEANRNNRMRRLTEEITGVGSWQYNITNDQFYLTSEAANLFNLPSITTGLDSERVISLFDTKSSRKIRLEIRKAIASRNEFKLEAILPGPDGTERIVELTGKPIISQGEAIMLYGTIQDITEVLQRKQQLEKLSLVARKTRAGVIITDASDRIEWVNDAFTELSGYSLEEVEGRSPVEFLSGSETDPTILKELGRAMKSQRYFKGELINYTKEGKPFWVRLSITPIFDEHGKILQFFSAADDITDRKQAELELQETEKKLRNIIEHSTNLYYQHDVDHRFTYLSPQAEQFLGISPDQSDVVWTDFLTDHPINKRGKMLTQRAIDTGEAQPPYTLELETRKGKRLWVQVNESPMVEEGQTVAIVGSLTDITDLKETQQTLINSKQQLEEAQKIGNVGHWDFEVATGDIHWSPQLFTIYERDPDLGEPTYEEILNYYPKDRELHDRVVREAIEHGTQYEIDLELHTPNGNIKYVIAIGLATKDEEGRVISLHGIVKDVTGLKMAQLELKRNEERLRNITNSIDGTVLRYSLDEHNRDEIIFISQGVETLYRITAEEAMKDISLIWKQIHPNDRKKMRASILKSKETMGLWEEYFRILPQEEGEEVRWVHARGTPTRLANRPGTVRWDTVLTDVTDLKKAQERNEVLLREIHHRVKNNLAIVSGLLQLELFDSDNHEVIMPLQRSQSRIFSMAKVHELLYRENDFANIHIGTYIREIAELIKGTIPESEHISIDFEVEDVKMNVNSAVPLGLLLNELITNSFKYAFSGLEEGNILIKIKKHDTEGYRVLYADNGIGFTNGDDINEPTTMGLRIINTLLKQLRANFRTETKNKFELELTFSEHLTGSHSSLAN